MKDRDKEIHFQRNLNLILLKAYKYDLQRKFAKCQANTNIPIYQKKTNAGIHINSHMSLINGV